MAAKPWPEWPNPPDGYTGGNEIDNQGMQEEYSKEDKDKMMR